MTSSYTTLNIPDQQKKKQLDTRNLHSVHPRWVQRGSRKMEPRCWFSPCKLQYIVEPKHQCKQASRIDCNTALSQFFWNWEAPKSHHTKHKGEWVDKEVKYQIPSLWLSFTYNGLGQPCSWWLLPLAKEIGSNWLTLPAKKCIVSGVSGHWNMWNTYGSVVGWY
jgi:hypothetical protein